MDRFAMDPYQSSYFGSCSQNCGVLVRVLLFIRETLVKVVRSKMRYQTFNPLRSVGSHARSCLPVANVRKCSVGFIVIQSELDNTTKDQSETLSH